MSDQDQDPFEGQSFRGYQLTKQIGVGGFGAVYRAYQDIIDREVAVKIVHERYAKQADFIRRFEAEARTIARVEDPFIVPLYDYWREPQGAFLVMRYLRGGSARSALETHGPWPIDSIVKLLDQVAAALSTAHQYGVIHRDIKPENILLDESNNAYLSDFGISVNIFTDPEDVLIENLSFGSPAYMAPEQLIRRTVTPLADIYSLGILIYELLTGELPFSGETTEALAKKHARDPVPSIKAIRPEMPEQLDAVIWRATAKAAGARYQDALSLAWAFKEASKTIMGQGSLPTTPVNMAVMQDVIPPGSALPISTTRDYAPMGSGTLDLQSQPVDDYDDSDGTLNLDPDTLPTGAPDGSESPGGATLDLDAGMGPPEQTGFDLSSREVDPDDMATGKLPSEEEYNATLDLLDTSRQGESTLDFSTEPFDPGDHIDLYAELDNSTNTLPRAQDGTLNMATSPLFQGRGTLDFSGAGGYNVRNPYKGLRPFEEFDASDFHGREAFIGKLLKHFTDKKRRFLALIGPSGSGKSSIVKAGLIPRLRAGAAGGSDRWFIIATVLSADPFQELSEALLRVALDEPEDLKQRLQADPEVLHGIVRDILPDEDTELLLFIDQFEELFTMVDDETERSNFLDTLTHAVTAPGSRIRIVITLRADFYDRPLQYKAFAELLSENAETVLPLASSELQQAIIGPAIQAGLVMPQTLAARIADAISEEAGALPLLQFALTELYERRDGNRLTAQSYDAINGVSGALARRADETYTGLETEDDRALVRQLFLRLITVEEAGASALATRRRVLWNDLFSGIDDRKGAEKVVDQFARFRLLTLDRDPTTRSPTVEIAHESLIHAWLRLQIWITENQDDLRRRERLRQATAEWLNSERESSFLANGVRLAEFETLLKDDSLALRAEETAYITASIAQRERINRLLRMAAAVFAVLAVFAFLAALVAVDRQQQAEENETVANRNAELSRSRELAAISQSLMPQTDLALLLGVEAARTANTVDARIALLTGLRERPFLAQYLNGHTDDVTTVAYSPDGTQIISGDADGKVIVWDAITGTQIISPVDLGSGAVTTVAYSPDGAQIMITSAAGAVHIMPANALQVSEAVFTGEVGIEDAAYHPDGLQIALALTTGDLIVLDAESNIIIEEITASAERITSLAFNADGSILATGGDDRRVQLWDTTDWSAIGDPLMAHENWVLALAFGREGTLVSGGADLTLAFWQVDDSGGTLIERIQTPHTNWITDLSINGDGRFVASASADESIRVWSIGARQQALDPLESDTGRVLSVAFHPQTFDLVSGVGNRQAIRWRIGLPTRPGTTAAAANGPVNVVTAAGDTMAVGTLDGQLNLFAINPDGDEITTLEHPINAHDGQITALDMSAAGTQVVTAGEDLQIHLWDVASGERLASFSSPGNALVRDVIYAERGGIPQIITAGDSDEIHFLDPNTGDAVRDSITVEQGGTLAIALDPVGDKLIIGGRDNSVQMVDLRAEPVQITSIGNHTNAVTALTFSGDGSVLASASRDRTIILWNFDADGNSTGRFRVLTGHRDWINDLALSPDGRTLASAGRASNNNVILWDMFTGRMLGGALLGHTAPVAGVAFNADGTRLFSGDTTAAFVAWEMDPMTWIATACTLANRDLTEVEWELYFRNESYRQTCTTDSD